MRVPRFDFHLHLSEHWPDLARNSYGPGVDFSLPGLLRELDSQGIGHGMLIQINESPSVESTLEEGTRLFRDSARRLLRTSTVDPTRGRKEVERAVALWERTPELVALKLYPGYRRFYPHDTRLAPLYEFAARRKLVVLIHQGDTLDPNGFIKFTRPVEVDEVAVRYREVRFVLCHLGNPWVEECAELVYKNENVYADTSGLLPPQRVPQYARTFARAQELLGHAVAAAGSAERFLYGSDWPLESIAEAVRLVEGLALPADDIERILGGNARTLLAEKLPS